MKLFGKEKNQDKIVKPKSDEGKIEKEVAPSGASLPKGGDATSYSVISSPHITEKGTVMGEQRKYVFKIPNAANKIDIKKAVEHLYKVKVAKVATLYVLPKSRQVGRHKGHKAGFKKAIVTLKEGNKIDMAN